MISSGIKASLCIYDYLDMKSILETSGEKNCFFGFLLTLSLKVEVTCGITSKPPFAKAACLSLIHI